MPLKHKLGALPRGYNLKIPHYGAVRRMTGVKLPDVPHVFDNAVKLPVDLGMMLNDRLGDCTCAGMGHATQLVSNDAQLKMLTPTDSMVLKAYEAVAGYNPRTGANDNGAMLQDVLQYWQETGIQVVGGRHKILGAVEIDPRYPADVAEAIMAGGYCYIGFNVPSDITEDVSPGELTIWDSFSGDIEGGHCVVLTGWNDNSSNPYFNLMSWGSHQYAMTANFMQNYVTEIYMTIDPMWIAKTGKSPLNMTEAQIEQIGQAIAA